MISPALITLKTKINARNKMRLKVRNTKTKEYYLQVISRSTFQDINKFVNKFTDFVSLIRGDGIWLTEEFIKEIETAIKSNSSHELEIAWLQWIINAYINLNPSREDNTVGLYVISRTTSK